MIAAVIVAAYLIGSIPFALILARRWGADLRSVGSGNLGAANVMRASGVTAGVLVAALDMAKGAASVWLAARLTDGAELPAAAGFAAIVGHIYPVWLRFRGGKGVATACGVFSMLTPLAVPPALALFVAVGLADEVHLARIGAGVDGAAAARLRARQPRARRSLAAAAAAVLIIVFRHRSNVLRAAGRAPSGGWERARRCGPSRCSARAAGARRWPCISAASATTSGCGRATRRWWTTCPRAARMPSTCRTCRSRPACRSTHALADALRGAELVVSAVPSHGCRAVMHERVALAGRRAR